MKAPETVLQDYCRGWAFNSGPFSNLDEFREAIGRLHGTDSSADEAIVVRLPRIRICWDGRAATSCATIEGKDGSFRAIDLLYRIHELISRDNDDGHVYFEGLHLVDYSRLRADSPLHVVPQNQDTATYYVALGS